MTIYVFRLRGRDELAREEKIYPAEHSHRNNGKKTTFGGLVGASLAFHEQEIANATEDLLSMSSINSVTVAFPYRFHSNSFLSSCKIIKQACFGRCSG